MVERAGRVPPIIDSSALPILAFPAGDGSA
jgi:hypothetical protein